VVALSVMNGINWDGMSERTPSGKIIKGELRKLARQYWEDRCRNGAGREPLANL